MANLMDTFIEGNPLSFSNPNFEHELKEYTYKNIFILLKHLYDETELIKEIK